MDKRITSYIEEHGYEDQDILFADGFEDAFMGVGESHGAAPKACYDYQKCEEILVSRDSMTWEEAAEFLQFNVTQAYVGEHTPAFINLL